MKGGVVSLTWKKRLKINSSEKYIVFFLSLVSPFFHM